LRFHECPIEGVEAYCTTFRGEEEERNVGVELFDTGRLQITCSIKKTSGDLRIGPEVVAGSSLF